jgi:hypothetical protein
VAFVILGVSSVFYAHYIDVRDVEAKILTREVVECISPEGVLDLDVLTEENKRNLLYYCGFDAVDAERFYVEINVGDIKLSHGDSGALWILSLFKKDGGEGIKKYEPGHYVSKYDVSVIRDGNKLDGVIRTEVMVKDEF